MCQLERSNPCELALRSLEREGPKRLLALVECSQPSSLAMPCANSHNNLVLLNNIATKMYSTNGETY